MGDAAQVQGQETQPSFWEPSANQGDLPAVTGQSSPEEKIQLFRVLFRGREDVYALFWINERTGKKGYSPASADRWEAKKGKPKNYLPLTDDVIRGHLNGVATIGVYPLLLDHTCWFLACDFDGSVWRLDALAFLSVCKQYGVPAYLERSRSGNGGHAWIFFSASVPATSARQLGMRLLRQTMIARGEMDLASYDRFFPNQDFMLKGGFGNLIALPLQRTCRVFGNTEFLNIDDPELKPWPDQWAFLSQIKRISPEQLKAWLEIVPPVTVGPGTTSKVSAQMRQRYPAPQTIGCVLGATLSVEKSGLPSWMLSEIKHLASLHNPEFYERQRLRFSTFQTPRFIKCYEEDMTHIHLPRGVSEDLAAFVNESGSSISVVDRRPEPKKLSLKFSGELSSEQERSIQAVLSHDQGVFVAPPGAGKTVMGCFAIARRNVPTLILAHRKPILEQWRAQLMELLGLPSKQIGQVGGGRNRRSGIVDLAMIQSLKTIDDLEEFFSNYGFLIVDECHHLPAFTFESSVRKAPVRYILGLTATPHRRDGLQDILYMQCGPIRHSMEGLRTDLIKQLIVRQTEFTQSSDEQKPIQEIFRLLVHDEARNGLIQQDVLNAVAEGRRCLILSQWKEHCRMLADGLVKKGITPVLLKGTLGKKERKALLASIDETPKDKPLIVIATGQYLGEGFDCPQLDTLFLAFPVAFKGKLVQYVGRILRSFEGKDRTVVYDYADLQAPVLRSMYVKRHRAYKFLEFEEINDAECSRGSIHKKK